MDTVKDVKNGAYVGNPIYVVKPFVVLSKDGIVLFAGELQEVKNMWQYYDNCSVEVRKHDLYLCDNSKICDIYVI